MKYGFRHYTTHGFLWRELPEDGTHMWDWTTDPGEATTWGSIAEALTGLQGFARRTGFVMFVLEPVKISEQPVKVEYTVEALK